MRQHGNSRTTRHGRMLIVRRVLEQGWSVTLAAEAAGISRTTAHKWLRRWGCEGEAGLEDRSSAPRRVWNRTSRRLVRQIADLRRRLKLAAKAIARELSMARSTVGGLLRRLGLSRARDLEPREPVVRYERDRPGELLHLDIKKLGRFGRPGKRVTGDRGTRDRGAGWEYVHVCVDDHSRVAFVSVEGDQRKETAVSVLRRTVAWYELHGVRVEAVMTDNGSAYVSKAYTAACKALGLRHLRTRPYRPQTNGKAERFIQTLQREWAYGALYESASARARALGPWLERYNRERPHTSLGDRPPWSRLTPAV